MKVYLASTHVGMTVANHKAFIEQGKPKYILNTFFQGEGKCKQIIDEIGIDGFLLDSGAFSFMSGAECTQQTIIEYTERYIDFIKRYQVKRYFEIDVDTIFGIEFVEQLRKKMERETGIPSIPVWHKGRGVDYFKRMVAEYDYIAIGGLVFHVKKSELPLIKKMATYAKNKGVKCHGLGFTKTRELAEWDWYSVDSSSWTTAAGKGGQMHTFNPNTGQIEQHAINGNGKKIKLSDLVLHNGLEWCKYQRYMESIERNGL